jgi:autotransporter-associated beta strand protein
MKTTTLLLRRALFLCAFLFGIFGVSWGQQTTVNYAQRVEYYNAGTVFTTGGAGAFNQGTSQVGMYANGGATKQVVAWRTLKNAGDNTGSNRSLQIGDEFRISVSANTVVGEMGFALLSSPSTRSSWNDRLNNAVVSVRLSNYGNWYATYSDGTTANAATSTGSNNIGGTTTYKNFVFTCLLTAPNRMNITITDGTTTSNLNDILLNNSNAITEYSIFLSDDWNGAQPRDIYWNTNSTAASDFVKNTLTMPIGGSNGSFTISGDLPDGLVANSTSIASVNALTKTGSGSLTLSGSNTYTGTTTISAGTLLLGAAGSGSNTPLGTTTGATTVSSGGVLNLNGFTLVTAEALTINGTGISSGGALINTSGTGSTWTGNVALSTDASVGGSGNLIMNGAISGANSLTKIGTGTLTLGATNSFGGASKSLTVAAGTVAITSFSDNLGNASNTFTLGTATTSGTIEFTPTTGIVSRSFTVATGGGTLRNLGSGTPTFAHSSGTFTGNLNGNLTLSCSSTGDIAFNLGISGTGGIIVNSSGSGKILMQPASAGSSTYTGSTTITSGSLYLQGANLVSNSSSLVLNGGTFGTGVSTGNSETLGTLVLTANSTISLGTGSHTLTFSASNLQSWTAGRTLTITGWLGTSGASGTAGKIFIGSSSSGLTVSQLSQITFTGFGEATILSTGEVVPKPVIYRSAQSGNWSAVSTWESSSDNGSTWVSATVAPGSDVNTTITIQNNHTVSQNNNYNIGSNNSIIINAGGTLNMTSAPTSNMTFSSMTVNGTLVRNNLLATYEGTISIGNGGKYIHAVNGASIPSITWNSGSTFEVTGITTATSFTAGSLQNFHHIIWHCQNQSSIFNFGGLTTINGNLTIQSTGASPSATSCLLLTNSTAITSTIAGNLTVTGGFFAPFGASTAGSSALNISGNLSISGGTFDIYRPAANTGTINLAGDFSMTGGTLTKGGNGVGNFNFNKNGTQSYSKSAGTIANAINFTVNTGSALSMGTNVLDGSTGTFTLSSGGGLETGHVSGITLTGATGAIQVSGARTYSAAANYTYNGSSAQVTGLGFTGANNLTINNNAGVTLSGSASLAGTLHLTLGTFTLGTGNTITVANGGAISRTSGSLASGSGTFTFAGTGTVTGTVGFNNVNIAGGVNFGTASTINGILTINSGGFVNTNAPTYATASTLKYNSGGTYGRGTEWSTNSGAGYPHHVQISNGTTLNLGANSGTSTTRQIAGDLTIDANSTLTMNAAGQAMTAELIVKGNYINNGTTNLSGTIGGDLVLEGDLTDNNAFNANGRAIFFRGNNTQSITSNSDPLDIDVVRFNKTGGEVILLQNLLIDETADPVQFAGVSILNLNGKTATFGKASVASQITMNSTSAIKGSATSTLSILGTGSFGTIRFDQTTPGTTNVLGTLTINRTSTGSVTLANALQIATALVLTDGTLSLGANTLTINGGVSRTSGTINASTGTLAFGNASNLSLPTSLFTGNILNFNKTSGAGTLTVNDNIVVTNNMSTAVSTGALVMAPSKQLTVQGELNNNGTFTLQNDATFVQATTGNGITGNGTFNVEKALAGNSSTWNATSGRFWYMGVPMNAIARSCFGNYAAGSNRVWSYNEISKLYTDIDNNATTLAAGTGYVHRRATNETLTFSASGTNGLYSSDLTLNNLSRTPTSQVGFHLISNPYMAYLDWDAVLRTNVEPTYYLRSHNNTANDLSALITYNALTGLESNNSSISNSVDFSYLAPLQAIWVRVGPNTGTGSLAMTRSMLSHQSGNPGLKNSTIFPTLARVNLLDGARFDQMLVFMNQDMTNGVDQYDSEKMFVSGAPQLYTMAAGKKLVMNGLKNNKKKISVPLYLELPQSKVYQLQLAEYNLEDGLILLEDKQEGTIQDFTINDTYAFYANSGVLSNRFVLHFFMPDATITAQGPSNSWVEEETSYTEGGSVQITADAKGKVQISLDQPETEKVEGTVQATDANGRVVYSGALDGALTTLELNVPSGIYYLTVQCGNMMEKKKVFIQD